MSHAGDEERALLAAGMLDGRTLDGWDLSPEDFGDPAHREIARTLRTLHADSRPTDPVSVASALERRGFAAIDIGRVSEVVMASGVTDAVVLRHHATAVRTAAAVREVRLVAGEVAHMAAQRGADLPELLARLSRLHTEVLERTTRQDRYATAVEHAMALTAELELRRSESGVAGLATGFVDLDAHIGGLRPGVLTVLGGRTSMGKSALARSFADNLTARGVGVHFFSLEDSGQMLIERQVADTSRVPLQSLASASGLRLADSKAIAGAQAALISRSCWGVEDQPVMTSAAIAASVRRRKRELGTRVVVVDYVQLIRERAPSPRERIGLALDGLFRLAREEQVAMVVLSQVNRENEKESRMPRLSDLKESGAIEEQASCVLLVHRQQRRSEAGRVDGEKSGVIIAKNKHGARDLWVPLTWDGPTATYRQHTGRDEEPYSRRWTVDPQDEDGEVMA